MTIVTANTPEIVVSIDVPKVRRFSVEDYHQLLAVGFLQEGDRVELIQGELVDMAAKGTKHIFCCQELLAILPDRVREQAISRCQDPIILSANSHRPTRARSLSRTQTPS
jgi:Uma2 family endonuclease